MATPSKIVEGFSISHAAILDGTTGAEEALGDIYGVREGSLTVDEGSYDNTGDDAILSSWFWYNFVNVSVRSGYISFDLINLLTGATIGTSGSGANIVYDIDLWTEDDLNIPRKPMLIRVPSKDHLGATRALDFILYSVQFAPIKFDGPTYKEGLVVDYSGRAVTSTVDETGASLAKRAIGRLVSRPA